MKKLKAISTSDWHLEGLKNLFPHNHLEVQMNEIDKIYAYALDKGIKHIFIPGDISDSYKMGWDSYIALYQHFKKYDGLINSYYIGGNHDHEVIDKTSVDFLKILSDDGTFKTLNIYQQPEQLEIDGVVVNFLPFPCRKSIKHKKPCLNFVHESYDGAVGDNGRTLRVKDEFKSDKRDFIISGHIHQYQYIKSKRLIYNGNPFQKNFGESLPKGFIVFEAKYKKDKLVVDHEFVNNHPEFVLESVLIESVKDFAKLSTDDNIRYRLYVDPTVVIPSDLRIKNPNVRQIWDSQGKKKVKELDSVEDFSQKVMEIPTIDPTKGLKSLMRKDGFSKSQIKDAESFVSKAASTFQKNIA